MGHDNCVQAASPLKTLHFTAGVKYTVGVTRRAPDTFSLWLNGSRVDAVARRLNDGGLLVQVQSPALCTHTLKHCRRQMLYVALM